MTITAEQQDSVEFEISDMLRDIRQACPEWSNVDVDVRNELIHKWRVSMLTSVAKRDATIAELRNESYAHSQDDGKLEREIERLQGQLAELRQKIAAKSAHINELITERDEYMTMMHEARAELRKPVAVEADTEIERIRAYNEEALAELRLQDCDYPGDIGYLLAAYDTLAQNHAREVSAREAIAAEMRGMRERADNLLLQAQTHAQEARTANATIAEIYQACSGATSEPGNWDGAKPVISLLAASQARERQLRGHFNDIIEACNDCIMDHGDIVSSCREIAEAAGEQKEHLTCNSYPLCRCGFKPGSLTFVCEYLAEQESGNG
jgi:Asp-tRNA(Asn)/Glu-tRNA(Gln) amidotransferase C subunit